MAKHIALDVMLKSFILSASFNEMSNKNWSSISRMIPGTAPQQCEKRYQELLQQHHNASFGRLTSSGSALSKSSSRTDTQADGRARSTSGKLHSYDDPDNKDANKDSSAEQSPVMVIHVCDEAKNLKQDFHCWRDLLVKEMKYFAEYLSSDAQRWEDVDISVHCDVQIFDWLMKYVKRHTRDVTEPPKLEPSNVISILISSEFLKMDSLVQECIEYCHASMNSIIATPCNMNCINDKLVSRIAELFTHSEADNIKDKKDKFKSKLFAKKIEKLFSLDNHQKESPESAYTLYRCAICKRLVTKTLEKRLQCSVSRMTIDAKGKLAYSHSVDPSWDVNEFIVDLKKQLGTWRDVYWRIWGHVNFLSCTRCGDTFPCTELGHCRYHRDSAEFDASGGLVGVHPCCGQKALRFDPTEPNTGCQVRDHVVNLDCLKSAEKDRPASVYEDLLAHRDAVAVPFQKLALHVEQDIPVNVFTKDESIANSRAGSAKAAKSEAVPSDDGTKSSEQSTNKPVPRLQALTVEKELSTEEEGEEGESEEDFGEEEDITKYYVDFPFDPVSEAKRLKITRKSRITVDPQAILLDAPDFSTTKIRKWDSSRSMRWNQDAQREEDQIRITEIVNYLTKLRLSSEKLDKLKQKEFAGGSFVKLEAQWKAVNMPPPKAVNSLTRTKTRLTALKI